MCTMRHILLIILLIYCVTVTIAKNEKKDSKTEKPSNVESDIEVEDLTEASYEEEARRDIENLLSKSKRSPNDVDKDLLKKNNTNILAKNDEELNNQLDQFINKLDNKTKSVHTNVETVPKRRNIYGLADEHEADSTDMSTRGFYNKFLRDMNYNNKEGIKKRLSTTNDKLSQFTKQIESSHRNAIKTKIAENFDELQKFLIDGKGPMRRLGDKLDMRAKVSNKIYVPVDRATGYYVRYAEDPEMRNDNDKIKNLESSEVGANTNYFVNNQYRENPPSIELSPMENARKTICRTRRRIQNAIAKEMGTNYLRGTDDDCDIPPVPARSRAVRKGHPGKRFRRATFTQAGYTQDPDTCKTYNENLAKLWSNLSKLINVTDQPNERALHNIAMMIIAYLDHQNAKPSDTFKVEQERTRDKVGEVILKIKKMLDIDDLSPENITKTITKNIKPFYGDVETLECQQLNEESLSSAVELLHKNYLKNAECRNDVDEMERSRQLRSREPKKTPKLSANWDPPNTVYKPDDLNEDELYKDFHKGKVPRKRPSAADSRRVFKRNKNQMSLIHRSGDQKTNVNDKRRGRSKSSKKRKNSLKSDDSCQQYAIRKLTVSLRPVIERFMSLLECQLDNTLRSLNHDRISMNPYYLYVPKYNSAEDSLRQKKNKRSRNNFGRNSNISYKKSNKNKSSRTANIDKNIAERNDDYNYQILRKFNLQENTASSVVDSFSTLKDEDSSNTEYLSNYDEYFQSPPLYDDYEGIYKLRPDNSDTDSSLIKPSKTDEKDLENKSTNKTLDLSLKEQTSENIKNKVHTIFEDDISDDTKYNQIKKNNTHELDESTLEKFSDNDQLTDDTLRQSPVKSYESITDFLRKARDESLQTPEFAVPFALDTNKGYVELTHLVKYPRTIMYRPQFLLKNTIPYDDFLKTINNFTMANDEVQLMKIVRHLPDNTVQVLFETEDFEPPLEFRNVKDGRRSGAPKPVFEYLLKKVTDEEIKNRYKFANSGFKNTDNVERFTSMNTDQARSNIFNLHFKHDKTDSDEYDSQTAFNSGTDAVLTSSISPEPTSSLGLLSSIGSGLIPGPNSDSVSVSAIDIVPKIGSDISSSVGSSIGSETETAPAYSPALPLQSMGIPSYHNQLQPLLSKSSIPITTNPSSILTKLTNTILQPSSNTTSPPSWWKNWKSAVKEKVQSIVSKMASLVDKLDHVAKL